MPTSDLWVVGEARFGVLMLLPALFLLATLEVGAATKYFVSLDGDDENDGRSRAVAFATLQRGVDALDAGDTLTILPGEYVGGVSRSDLGGPDADTVIRAEINGTVIIRGDVPAPAFRKVKGSRFTYAADFETEHEIHSVNELDTLRRLSTVPELGELYFSPGTSYYDADNKKLYLSTPDMVSASGRRYTVSLRDGHGLSLTRPRRVRVEGLSVTGFAALRRSGISLNHPYRCVVVDCRAYFNRASGMTIGYARGGEDQTGHNVIKRFTAWGNGNGIDITRPRNDTVRDSQAFRNRQGIRIYQSTPDWDIAARLQDLLVWGNNTDFGTKARSNIIIERGIGPGLSAWEVMRWQFSDSVLGRLARGTGDNFRNTIYLPEHDELDQDTEFADSVNHDYRLQATSRFRGAGEDGADLGLPYEANIFYVSPEGNDAADGLAAQNAWATLARAAGTLRPGDTLYILPGRYMEDLVINAGEPDGEAIAIRGRGADAAEIAGNVRVANSHNLGFERLDFHAPVAITGGGCLVFEQCAFGGGVAARGVEGLRVFHCEFSRDGSPQLDLSGGMEMFLAGNRFENTGGAAVSIDDSRAVLYADYNAYRRTDSAWRLGGETVALDRLPAGMERYATAVDVGEATAASGPYGHAAGRYRLDTGRPFRIAGPFMHAVGATSANIELYAMRNAGIGRREPNAVVEIAWGETPECENVQSVPRGLEFFGSVSLTGLEPDTKYYVRLNSVRPVEAEMAEPSETDWCAEPISFTTTRRYADPVTYHVSPGGDDANSGYSPTSPLRTLYRASELVRPGDTVLTGEGVYKGRLYLRATGLPDRPITFAGVPGKRAVLEYGTGSGGPYLIGAYDKSHIRIDGLYLGEITYTGSRFQGAVRLQGGRDIEISRLFYDGRRRVGGFAPAFLNAKGVRNLRVSNCVSLNQIYDSRIVGCPGFRMENTAIVHTINGGVMTLLHPRYVNEPEDRMLFANSSIP